MDLDKSLEVFIDRFSDASDFTFYFVGRFEVDQLKPLVRQYLGSLPATYRNESWRDEGVRPPKGIVRKQVYRGLEEKSRVDLVFSGPFEMTRENRLRLNALADVFRIKLREVLREDMGGTYGVSVSVQRSPCLPRSTALSNREFLNRTSRRFGKPICVSTR
jgi:zinc protease